MLKRTFDIIVSSFGLIFLSPLFIVIAIAIKLTSKGPVLFSQKRVGRFNKDFDILKFRSMYYGIDDSFPLTIGEMDVRVTKLGKFLRKYKLDEFPQLINVLKGEMSMVGPRPVLRKFVDYYTPDQMHILDVRPGITDYASIKYRNEGELLEKADDPLDYYLKEIMPDKIQLDKMYIKEMNLWLDIKLIIKTLFVNIF